MIGLKAQREGEIRTCRAELERRDRLAVHSLSSAHLPRVDPGAKGLCLDARLSDAATRKGFAVAVGVGTRDRRMPHPDTLIGPALLLRAGMHGISEQRPLRALCCPGRIHEIGRHVPPFDMKLRMRAMIGGKAECPAWDDGRKSIAAQAEACKALRERLSRGR